MLLNYLLFHEETWECNNCHHHTRKNNNVRENVRLIEHGSMSSTVSYFSVSRISWGEDRALNVVCFLEYAPGCARRPGLLTPAQIQKRRWIRYWDFVAFDVTRRITFIVPRFQALY
jgi:hypothetical protein